LSEVKTFKESFPGESVIKLVINEVYQSMEIKVIFIEYQTSQDADTTDTFR